MIVVLLVSLLFLVFSEKQMPDNGYLVDSEVIRGEKLNQEMVNRINALFDKEPVLKELPLTVEYFSDDYSKYTKYILSYELDDSERGFFLIMKDYTGEGSGVGIMKLNEMGMKTEGLVLKYEDLTDGTLNFRAE